MISSLLFAFLSTDLGLFNRQIFPLPGIEAVNWYIEPVY